jgi:hypothetical protein
VESGSGMGHAWSAKKLRDIIKTNLLIIHRLKGNKNTKTQKPNDQKPNDLSRKKNGQKCALLNERQNMQ